MADKVLLRRVALGLVVFAVAVPPGVSMAQDGDPVRIGVDGVPLRECDRATGGCVGHRTEFVVLPPDVPLGALEPYFPQELMRSVYRRTGLPEEPLTCSILGNGFDLARTDLLVAQFVSFREAIGSGLQQAEYDFFLADERNYLLWIPAQYGARSDRDPAGWLPPRNACWYLRHYMSVKERWSLALDWVERDAIQDIMDVCRAGRISSRRARPTFPVPGLFPRLSRRRCRRPPSGCGAAIRMRIRVSRAPRRRSAARLSRSSLGTRSIRWWSTLTTMV